VILKTGITLTHTVGKLELLSGANRSITGPAIGYYSCQGGDYWVETQYIPQGSNSVEAQFNNVAARLNAHDSEIYNLWTAIGNIQIGMDLRCTPIGPGVERIAIPDLPKPEGTIHSGRSSNSNDDPSTVTSCCAKQAAE